MEGQVTLSALLGTLRVCISSPFFGHFDGLERSRFKSCERIYTIELFSSQNQIFRYVYLSVPDCSLVENILDTFCIAQIWYDLSILRMFTVVKCRVHTNFDQSKIYEGYYQLIYDLVQ